MEQGIGTALFGGALIVQIVVILLVLFLLLLLVLLPWFIWRIRSDVNHMKLMMKQTREILTDISTATHNTCEQLRYQNTGGVDDSPTPMKLSSMDMIK